MGSQGGTGRIIRIQTIPGSTFCTWKSLKKVEAEEEGAVGGLDVGGRSEAEAGGTHWRAPHCQFWQASGPRAMLVPGPNPAQPPPSEKRPTELAKGRTTNNRIGVKLSLFFEGL